MHRRIVLIILLLQWSVFSRAQSVNLSDSLYQVFRNKPKPSLKLDFRNSFITGSTVQIGGVKAGMSFGKTLNLGVGYSWLYSHFDQVYFQEGIEKIGRLRMRYLGPYVEYSFYRKNPWEAMVTANISYGSIFLDPNGRSAGERLLESGAFIYEPTIAFEYKIANLVGVGAGYGYRFVSRGNRDIEQQFTAPVYVLRFRLILDRFEKLWKDRVGKEE
jgi:hypothetical protein